LFSAAATKRLPRLNLRSTSIAEHVDLPHGSQPGRVLCRLTAHNSMYGIYDAEFHLSLRDLH
jgi:hypothetical protein